MCRNIHTLHNLAPAADVEEARAAALQYVRKISGTTRPSRANAEAFDRAVDEVTHATLHLLDSLVAATPPRDREELAAKARARAARRYARPDATDTGDAAASGTARTAGTAEAAASA